MNGPGQFRVLTTPAFEREFRKACRAEPRLVDAFEGLLEILREDPHNRSGAHDIKKLAGLKPGEGQWRLRWRSYRMRYDIVERDVVLHSFRHRREAY